MNRLTLSIWTTLALASALAVTGCAHFRLWNHQPAAPALQTSEGSIEAQQKARQQPPPPSTLPQPAASSQTKPPALPPATTPKVERAARTEPVRHNPPATTQADVASPAPSSPTSSPIGKLTTGDSTDGSQKTQQQDTVALMQQTEERLAKLKPLVSPEDRATADQARVFLSQAKHAFAAGDTDGAHTLATKAKLLLDELTGH